MAGTKKHHFQRFLINAKVLLWLSVSALALTGLTSCGGEPDLQIGPAVNGKRQGTEPDTPQVPQTIESYQIGDEWDAKKLTVDLVNNENSYPIYKAAINTVYIRTLFAAGTGFYLGEHNGQFLVATNAHVLKNIISCNVSPVTINFKFLKRSYTCANVIGIWRSIDFAILALNTDGGARQRLRELDPLEIDRTDEIEKNTLLYSAGYGKQSGNLPELTLKGDDDCRVYSPTETFARLDNPQEKEARAVLSFAVGCDISPGDSGSPILDRKTGKLLGIIWSTYAPKPVTFQTRAFMERLRSEESDDIWKYMAYAVPVAEIRQELIRWTYQVERSRIMAKRRQTVLDLLGLDL